jgi:mannose-1-phosphate guanylyltransferase / phosphomannomutase
VVGPGCVIEAGARLGEYSVLGSNVRVRSDVQIERSVVHDNAYLASGVSLRGTIVGRSCDLRNNARCADGVVLGDECFIGDNAVLAGGVKVYPFKTVEAGAMVNSSIVWESKGSRSLFGRQGVSGLANVDITPELAAKLAVAYGTSLRKGITVVTSRDSSRSARMLKRAMMAGLNSTGIDVLDLEVASMPVTRFLTRSPRAQGGLSVRLDPRDPNSVMVRFFDADGGDITEDTQRKIERLYQREDHRRVFPAELGDINFPPRALEEYTVALEATVDLAAIYKHRFKLVIDNAAGATSLVMPNVLAKLGAEVLSVNPYASTGGIIAFDPVRSSERVANLVRASGAHLGAVLDPDGERLTLIDDEGRVLTHTESTLAFCDLVADHLLGDRIALPVNTTSKAAEIVSGRGIQIHHTKLSSAAIMDAVEDAGVGFAADGAGGFVLPGFLAAFDAAAALVKLLDLLAKHDRRLSHVVDALPKVFVAHETVVTPWESKGTVMRSLVEAAKDREMVLVDGVKVIHHDGWALAIPDPEEPLTHIWAEAGSDGDARTRAQEYGRRIRQMIR